MLGECGCVCAGAAANVEQSSRPVSKQTQGSIARLIREFAGRELRSYQSANPS